MAGMCPLCNKHRMYFGGMVIKDGIICGKCWDRLASRKISSSIKNLTYQDIWWIFDNTEENQDLNEKVPLLIEQREEFARSMESSAADFCDQYTRFFQNPLKENSPIQNSATQFFWHSLVLNKRRLDKKGIVLKLDYKPSKDPAEKSTAGRKNFDGKYETANVAIPVKGTLCYLKQDKILKSEDRYNLAKYRTINAHEVGGNKISCPNCGSLSTRENLMDGCDYCGTKFTVEDLGLRFSQFLLENNKSQEARQYFNRDNTKSFGKKFFTYSFLVLSVLTVLSLFTEKFTFSGMLAMLFGSAVLAGFITLPAVMIYSVFVRSVIWMGKDMKGSVQSASLARIEFRRASKKAAVKIHGHDPNFSVEGFYSEVNNMLSAIHYADSVEAVKVFWHNQDLDSVTGLVESYSHVVGFSIDAIQIVDYKVEQNLQKLSCEAQCSLLKESDEKITEQKEKLALTFVKDSSLKTQEVCAPTFLRCGNCGSSISLMDGAHCQYCGNDGDLSQIAWTLEEYKVL